MQVVRLNKNAKLPEKKSKEAAGYDLYSLEARVVPAGGKTLLKTGIKIAIPYGWYGRIAPRSSLAWKKHIDVGAGVIDSDYRGELMILLFNHGKSPFFIDEGDRVAQLIIERCAHVKVIETDVLRETQRGEGGFGSTDTFVVISGDT